MSRIIIVKIERITIDEVRAHNFTRRYDRRLTMNAEIAQILKDRRAVFAEARLRDNGELLIVRRARDRKW